MDPLRQLLFENGRVGRVLDALRQEGLPDPQGDPSRALLYGHALTVYGDHRKALEVFSSVPPGPPHEAERLWGLASAHLRLGDLGKVKPLLDEALTKNPSPWLLPRLYNTLTNLNIYLGRLDQALSALAQGIAAAQEGNHLTEQLVLEGNRGIVQMYQGAYEEAVFQLQKAVKQLLDRDSVLAAANFLVNLGGAFFNLGALSESKRSLLRAERLVLASGSKSILILLRQMQGEVLRREGPLNQAKRAFEETLELLRELPNPTLEAQLKTNLAHIVFQMGDLGAALSLIRQTRVQAKERGLALIEVIGLGYEGEFLLSAGSTREGLAVLEQARGCAEALGMDIASCFIALYLAQGYEELNERERALEWLSKCFSLAERCQLLTALLNERSLLAALLLKLGRGLPATDFLHRLTIQLRHPVLVNRLLRGSPEGKVHFLRALGVHEARNFRVQLAKLKNDPHKEVRRTCRLVLSGWQQHTAYRVYTLGPFRAFREGRLLAEEEWVRPAAKRLFLCLSAHPGIWHPHESLLEALWQKPHPQKTRKGLTILFTYLRKAFEPWSRLAGSEGNYVFFKSRRGAYGFFPEERFWIDSKEFEEKAKYAERAHLQRNVKEARKAFRGALDLYLGDYLEEFPYEDWLREKRDYLRETYFRSVQRYAALERDSGNLPEARRVLEEALFRDLSRSDSIALLIQVLSRMKLTQQARDWGRDHIKYMKEELKEKPAPEVVEALSKLQ